MHPKKPNKINVLVFLSYDGHLYQGFQHQLHGVTIEDTIKKAFSQLFKEPISIIGASRTDSKAHAIEYCLNAYLPTKIPLTNLPLALNKFLPKDIRILKAFEVPSTFHATSSASARKYIYILDASKIPLPFFFHYTYYYSNPIDITALKKVCKIFKGNHEFNEFCYGYRKDDLKPKTFRRIDYLYVTKYKHFVLFFIKGEGFLRGMIRSIISVCLSYNEHKISLTKIKNTLDGKENIESYLKVPVPAKGLYLKKVYYPKNTINM